MKRESVFFTITISFVISILLVIVSFSVIIHNKGVFKEKHLSKKYFPIVRKFVIENKRDGITDALISDFKVMNIDIVQDKGTRTALLYNPKTKVLINKRVKRFHTKVLKLNKTNYIYIKNRNNEYLLKDTNTEEDHGKFVFFLVFGIIIVTLVISYLTTLRKLYPLKILKDKVTTLGDENFDFDCCDTTKKDEVSLLALEFKNTAQKLQTLKESRNVFIRNIMHELKTPITKGRFLIELNNTEENVEKLKKVFFNLETLINDFASIEELITSSTNSLDKNYYFLEDIVDEAVDKLMIESDAINNSTSNLKVHVHFKLFSVAIKNLIDNAIKYGDGSKPILKTQDENIIIENHGKELCNELESYFEPFSKDENKKQGSFGLGLYIVHHVLKANGYTLEYEYDNGINTFKCMKVEENN